MAGAVIEKCPTGISGLDKLIEGGFPRGRVVLVSGDCGTGKSIFATQFLYNGALKYNEGGIIVTLEQSPDHIREDMMAIGFDLKKLEDDSKLIIVDASISNVTSKTSKVSDAFKLPPSQFSIDAILSVIAEAAEKINAKRIVIDSFSALDSLIETRKTSVGFELMSDVRRAILGINYRLQELNLTSILISEIIDGKLSTHGVEEFMVDGVITLQYNLSGPDRGRNLIIKKMRTIKHSENIHPIEFVRGVGIKVLEA